MRIGFAVDVDADLARCFSLLILAIALVLQTSAGNTTNDVYINNGKDIYL